MNFDIKKWNLKYKKNSPKQVQNNTFKADSTKKRLNEIKHLIIKRKYNDFQFDMLLN